MTVSQHIRNHALKSAENVGPHNPAWLYRSQWVPEFEHLMRNRLVMGALRYGTVRREALSGRTDFSITLVKRKLDEYVKTGNAEMLVDIANVVMIEFVMGDHPEKHFKAVDRK